MFERSTYGAADQACCRAGEEDKIKTWYIPECFPAPEEPVRSWGKLKIRVKFAYEEEDIPSGILVIPAPDIPVPDGLGDIFKRWCPRQGVILVGPTGSGKSTYAARIIRHANAHRQHVLLLCHRSLITGQQKRALLEKLHSRWAEVTDTLSLELTYDFTDVRLTVMTYQAFARRYQTMDLKKYAWVLCDEAHYFASDALFSESADALLEQIPRLFAHACRVYMTATPGAVLEDLVRVERKAQPYPCGPNTTCWRDGCGQMLLYHFPNHFQGLQLRYFHQVDEIVRLAQAHPGEKFLIFISARENPDEDGNGYLTALKQAGIETAYLDRDRKDSRVWQELLEQSSFSAQVLVSTSVIDCGVNLIDDSLRHVVLETTDKSELIQMLGRRRREPEETLNVYIRAASTVTLNQRLRKTEQWLDLCRQAFQSGDRGQARRMLLAGWTDRDPERPYAKLLVPSGSGGFRVKLTAYHALRWQEGTLRRLLRMEKEHGDGSALPRLVHEWLDDPGGYREENWLHHDIRQENRLRLVQFLEERLGEPVTEEALSALQSLILPLHKEPHDEDRRLKPAALNRRLQALALPYEIQKTNSGTGVYILARSDGPAEKENFYVQT